MRLWIVTAGLAAALACGCQRRDVRPGEYKTLAEDPGRDTSKARQENARAIEHIAKGDLDAAEKTLKEALAADLFYGPAHNNLGTVYHRQEKFYLAAWEFQYAAKLMPHSAEPRANLGMVYEAVGRREEAEKWYDTALGIEPDNPVHVGNLARLRVRAGRSDAKTYRLLEDLALKDTRSDWARWARDHLALMPKPDAAPADTPPLTLPDKSDKPKEPEPPAKQPAPEH